jgi:hypothetical protein
VIPVLSWLGERGHASADVDGDAADVAAAALAFACVQPGSEGQADLAIGVDRRQDAADRPGRAGEGR